MWATGSTVSVGYYEIKHWTCSKKLNRLSAL